MRGLWGARSYEKARSNTMCRNAPIARDLQNHRRGAAARYVEPEPLAFRHDPTTSRPIPVNPGFPQNLMSSHNRAGR